jgi:glycerophosphoryl diester phosphodiesterase
VYGHRGAPRQAPENTLRSFRLALEQGADGVELDVRHDRDLLRVAGAAVAARQATLAQLRALDLGGGAKVPLLDEALELVLGAGARLNVELKASGEDPAQLVPKVLERVRRWPGAEQAHVLFSSFSPEVCARVLAHAPGAAIALLFEHERKEPAAGIAVVHPDHALVDAAALASWKARGLLVNAWTVNDAERACELAELGVDGLITDNVVALRRALDGRGPAPVS